MEMILHVDFLGENTAGKRFAQGYARKTVDLPFAPFVGMDIECLAWEDAKKVVSVSLNVDDLCLHIWMGIERPNSPEHYQGVIGSYKDDGWQVVEGNM